MLFSYHVLCYVIEIGLTLQCNKYSVSQKKAIFEMQCVYLGGGVLKRQSYLYVVIMHALFK
jgi:hypothetical protein